MISALTAYKEMILSSATGKPADQNRKVAGDAASDVTNSAGVADGATDNRTVDAVSVDLSASHDVFTAVDDFFNLGRSGRFDAFHKLSREEKEQFVNIVAELAKAGYIGYEELIVNKKVERHEMTTQIGDDRLRAAKVYDRAKGPTS